MSTSVCYESPFPESLPLRGQEGADIDQTCPDSKEQRESILMFW